MIRVIHACVVETVYFTRILYGIMDMISCLEDHAEVDYFQYIKHD